MKLLIYNFLIIILLFRPVTNGFAQNIDNLRTEREALYKEIESINNLISSKKKSRESAFEQINILNKEISTRERLIVNFKDEILFLENKIEINQAIINNLEIDINLRKNEYGKILMGFYRRRNSLDELVFYLSAGGFSEAYNRYRLVKEYSKFRKNQVQHLIENQIRLKSFLANVKSQMNEKEVALGSLENEFKRLNDSQNQKRKLLNELQKEEKWLISSLKERERKAKDLDNKILEIVKASKASVTATSTGGDFGKFLGKLIWPVTKGIVVSRFGEHEHPVLKNVLIKNNGIDIQTSGNEEVVSVHVGEVSRIISIPGYNNAVIIRHGNYLTVYANLREVGVKQGQNVKAGDFLGKVYKEVNDAGGILHFEIWNENQKLDPAKWLIQ